MANFEKTLGNLKQLAATLKEINSMKKPASIQAAGNTDAVVASQPSPQDVGKALAELLKSDNSLTQAIAVRIANLAAAHPNKAY